MSYDYRTKSFLKERGITPSTQTFSATPPDHSTSKTTGFVPVPMSSRPKTPSKQFHFMINATTDFTLHPHCTPTAGTPRPTPSHLPSMLEWAASNPSRAYQIAHSVQPRSPPKQPRRERLPPTLPEQLTHPDWATQRARRKTLRDQLQQQLYS